MTRLPFVYLLAVVSLGAGLPVVSRAATPPASYHHAVAQHLLEDEWAFITSATVGLVDHLIDANLGLFPSRNDTAALRKALGLASSERLGVDVLATRRTSVSLSPDLGILWSLDGPFVGELRGERVDAGVPENVVALNEKLVAALIASPYPSASGAAPWRLLLIGRLDRVVAKLDLLSGRKPELALGGPRKDGLFAQLSLVKPAPFHFSTVLAGETGPDITTPPRTVEEWVSAGALSATTLSIDPGKPTRLVMSGSAFVLDHVVALITEGRKRGDELGSAVVKHFDGIDAYRAVLPELFGLRVPSAFTTLGVKRGGPGTLAVEVPSLAALGLVLGSVYAASLSSAPSCEEALAHVSDVMANDPTVPEEIRAEIRAGMKADQTKVLAECEADTLSFRKCIAEVTSMADIAECEANRGGEKERIEEGNAGGGGWLIGALLDRLLFSLEGKAWPALGMADVGDSMRAMTRKLPEDTGFILSFDLGGFLNAWLDRSLGFWKAPKALVAAERKRLGDFTRRWLGVDLASAKALHFLLTEESGFAPFAIVEGTFKSVDGAVTGQAELSGRAVRASFADRLFTTVERGHLVLGSAAGVRAGLAMLAAPNRASPHPLETLSRKVMGAPFASAFSAEGIDVAVAIGGDQPLDVWAAFDGGGAIRGILDLLETGRSKLLARAEAALQDPSGFTALDELLLAKTRELMSSYDIDATDVDVRLKSAHWAGYVAVACAAAFDALVARIAEGVGSSSPDSRGSSGENEGE